MDESEQTLQERSKKEEDDETRDDSGKREGATRDAVGDCKELVLDRSDPDEGVD